MSSKRQKKKGWILPAAPDELTGYDLLCVCMKIPNHPRYIAAFRGAMDKLAEWSSWERSYTAGDTRASTVRQYWRELIYEHLEIGMCYPFDIRQNPEDDCEIQKSLDGGETWVTAWRNDLCAQEGLNGVNNVLAELQYSDFLVSVLNLYDGTVASVSPNLVYTGDSFNGDRDAALCWALSGFVDMVCAGAIKKIENPIFGINLGQAAIALVAAILLIPTFGMSAWAFVGMGIAAAGLELFEVIITGVKTDYEDLGARQEIVCAMYNKLKGATLTNTAWLTALDDFTPTGTPETKIAELVTEFLPDLNSYIALLKIIEQGFALSKIGAIEPCLCDTWTVERLGGDGNANMVSLTIDGGLATYDAANDRYVGAASAGKRHALIVMESPGVPFFVESIGAEFTVDNNGTINTHNYIAATNGEGTVGTQLTVLTNAVDGAHTLGVNDHDADMLGIAFRLEAQSTTGFIRLNKVTITGRGFNPFA